jgi:SAM-dependent methyltransferase
MSSEFVAHKHLARDESHRCLDRPELLMSLEAVRCRFCESDLRSTFLDLGMSPLCENYLTAEQLNHMEPFFPLHVLVCDRCFLVQLREYVSPKEIFSNYAYFSSYSDSWLRHAKNYVNQMVDRFRINERSHVVEIASNDGYLLQYFVARRIPSLGIEPAANIAEAARKKGIPTLVRFFGLDIAHRLAGEGKQADLLLGNNVLSQVPQLNDFIAGMKVLLKPQGVITMEFPHLMRLMQENQFDTIYHEHFSYFSFITTQNIFAAHGLSVFDVEELSTHGGSLRIYACHAEDRTKMLSPRVHALRHREELCGFNQLEIYSSFAERVHETKRRLLETLIAMKRAQKTIVGYGAPGKGNTLLNYCAIGKDFLDYTVDRNPHKQGKFLPGTHIPIHHPDRIRQTRPDYLLVLPWNIKDEIMQQMSHIRDWNGMFVVPIPTVRVYSSRNTK